MNWFKRVIRNWLHSDTRPEVIGGGGPNPLNLLGCMDNPAILMVAPIDNGFLIMTRTHNPAGPDNIKAMFAHDAESLSTALVNRLAQARLKI